MTFRQLQKIAAPHYYSLTIDKFLPKILRTICRKASAIMAIAAFALSFDILPLYFGRADGWFFLLIIIYLVLFFVEVFYRSMMDEGVQVRINENLINNNLNIDYALSSVLFATDEIDVVRALFETEIGLEILGRSGIPKEACRDFIYSNRVPIMASSVNFVGEQVDLSQYMGALYDADKSLQSFLSRDAINREEFVGAVAWVMMIAEKKRRRSRFWGRENLGAMPSIGKSWSYGVATDLGKYGTPFLDSVSISLLDIENGYREKEISLLEGILERKAEGNAIIIDDDEDVARDVIGRLVKKIQLGISLPSIEHKTVIELDWNALISSYKNKTEFEAELLKILNQSISAGNVILYVRDISGFVSNVKAMGINLGSLISPYLLSADLQVVASVNNADFHFFIETNPALLQKFERIIPAKVGVEASVPVLLEQVLAVEKQYGFIFSYASILALAKAAERFVTYGEMPSKALDMLIEIAPWVVTHQIAILKENDVSVFTSEKTGIASGPIKEKEANQIEHLEELLHKRVIGQDEAMSSIANAVKRVRSGVGNPKRPLASFLFIGPTGVGKTEVSKALAESFFGPTDGEDKMIRFDMSEYNSASALSELIGDFALNKSGLLASRVRDNPYSVLLLDEFEKASPDVLDLFLQILDEGIFTDALGRQVNCRNLIIIATSNAGSALIWDTIRAGKNLLKEKDNIINAIIKEKVFKPELLNRFDGVILFHPLLKSELQSIARLGLSKLAKRLKEQNIELVINDDVINFLVEKSGDPQFGGRAINRAIQNEIEDLVARQIVSGEAKPGSRIELNKNDLQ